MQAKHTTPEAPASSDAADAAYRRALDAAVRSLARREHSRWELARKLAGKGHPGHLVEQVLDRLAEQGLQSDERFADAFVRSRVRKGYGPVKIRQELSGRGVEESIVEGCLTEPSRYWLEVAERALEKKFGPRAAGTPEVTGGSRAGRHARGVQGAREAQDGEAVDHRQHAWTVRARFLARRGFPSDLIYRLLDARGG